MSDKTPPALRVAAMEAGRPFVALDVAQIVRPVRRRLATQLLLGWAGRGAAAALISTAIFVTAGHLLAWPDGDPLGGPRGWAILMALLIAATVVAIVVSHWPTVDQAIREADRRLGLKDRLTTAREFAGRDSDLHLLQRQELARTLQGTDLRQAVRPKLRRHDAALIALGALLVLGATLLPNPQATAQAQQRQQRQVARYAAARTAALVHLPQSPTPPTGDGHQPLPASRNLRAVQSLLRRLQGQLAAAKSPVQAIKALTAAQQGLQHLNTRSSQAQQALGAAARALASGPTTSLARALQGGNPAATRKAFDALAKALPKLSAAERQALSKALSKAAAGQQGQLAQALQKAAQATEGDPAAADRSLSTLSQQLQEAQASASAAPATTRALQDLARIKQDVANGVAGPQQPRTGGTAPSAGATGGPQDQSAPEGSQPGKTAGGKPGGSGGKPGGKPGSKSANGGQGQPGANGNQPGSKSANGGQPGSKSANGNQPGGQPGGQPGANGSQPGANSSQPGGGSPGAGAMGSAGHGGSGGSGGAGSQGSGRFERVYLPGERHGGPSTQTQGALGRSVQVQTTAFRQLVSQYAQAADTTLGRAVLPPDRQAAVKRYFQSLEQN